MLTVKLLLNSIVLIPNEKIITINIKDFYLNMLMPCYKYMSLKLSDLPEDVIRQYNLIEKLTKDGYVYIEICSGMYRLTVAGILAQQLLEKRINKEGYK